MPIKEDEKLFDRNKLLNHNFNVLNLTCTNKRIDANSVFEDAIYVDAVYNYARLDYFDVFDASNNMCHKLNLILQNNKRSHDEFNTIDLNVMIMKNANLNSQVDNFGCIDDAFNSNADQIEVSKFVELTNKYNCNYLFINLSFCFICPDNYIYFSNTNKIIKANDFEKLINKLEEDLNFINDYTSAFNENSYFKTENTFYYSDNGKIKKCNDMRFDNKIYLQLPLA